jgi:hypothetical protein
MDNNELRAMMKKLHVTPTHIYKRAKAVNKKLKRVKVYFKPTVLPSFNEKRLKAAKLLLQVPLRERRCFAFLDEAKIWIQQPPTGFAIGEKGDHIILQSPLTVGAGAAWLPKNAQGKLHFFLCVTAKHGIVHFQFLSDTTNDIMRGRYKVRTYFILTLI